MKPTTITNGLAMALGAASPAFAAAGAREDNSGIFVWIFLGFCALIVVAQIMPAVLLMTGFIKARKGNSAVAQATE